MSTISRRSFLSTAGAAAASLMVPALALADDVEQKDRALALVQDAKVVATDPENDPTIVEGGEWAHEADAIVIGAGGGGYMAAIELARAGLVTMLIDADETVPPISSSYLCGGYIDFCETDLTPDSREELFADFVAAAQNDCQEDLVRAYVDNAAEAYNKMVEYGVKFEATEQVAYMSKPWAHIVEGNLGGHAIEAMAVTAQNDGVVYLSGNRARKLIQDETGRVVGVEVEVDGERLRYKANKGIILTTGGFTRNLKLAKNFGRRGIDNAWPITGMNSLGDGLIMGLDVRADTAYLGAGCIVVGSSGLTTHTTSHVYMTNGAINVSLEGKRFHDESDNYVLVNTAALDLPEGLYFSVYDAPMRKVLEDWTGLIDMGLPREPEIVADTLEELAATVKEQFPQFDDETFLKTVADYNSYVADGLDPDFGRAHITGITGDLVQIEQGPFYAVPFKECSAHFNGGLRTDAGARVVDVDDDLPIPGLYAAGEVAGGFNGYGYMSGSMFGKTVVHGMVAAKSLIEDNA